ncbi:hypothetical protein CEXT_152411 [Caerostris extrusa]|uniref:Uncharacterized protein n=1 Tax=Caerostris extrusa TaxID=172846 RepID=A0AAV4WQY5_CAEEX|nr:hypothetical protein CEXT_152411 [Caerostris extrusa]
MGRIQADTPHGSERPGGQVASALAFGIPGFRFESEAAWMFYHTSSQFCTSAKLVTAKQTTAQPSHPQEPGVVGAIADPVSVSTGLHSVQEVWCHRALSCCNVPRSCLVSHSEHLSSS